jgi:fermentation-respiration switch protein FrsA (DUF1100 family)
MGKRFAQLPFYQRLLIEVAAIYLIVVVGVFFGQRYMEYFPYKADPGAPKDSGVPEMKTVHVKTADNLDLIAWFAPPKKKGGDIVVMFHGNGGNIAMRGFKARVYLDRGYGVFLSEYRGYSTNPGDPTEQGLYADARAGLKWLDEQGYKHDQLVIYGESIGTGVAVQMALETQPKFLILEAPFSSAAAVAKGAYHNILPVDLLMKDRYDSVDKIPNIKSRLLVVHGTDDTIVPIQYGKQLFAAANKPKKFYVVHGANHLNLYNFGAGTLIADWLDKQVAQEKTP